MFYGLAMILSWENIRVWIIKLMTIFVLFILIWRSKFSETNQFPRITLCKLVYHEYNIPVRDPKCALRSIKPRQTRTLTDFGKPNRFRGWVDVQGQGEKNDYARYVGPNDRFPFVWFSIALAGSEDQYTDPGLYEECSGLVRRKFMIKVFTNSVF